MKNKILTHPELYEESLRLEDLINEYKQNNDYNNLEKALLDIIPIYVGLNYCEEDEYLDNMNEVYNDLLNIYIVSLNKEKIGWSLDKLLENWDLLIQRDIGNDELINEHVNNLNEMINIYKDYLSNLDILKEYPRLKEYVRKRLYEI